MLVSSGFVYKSSNGSLLRMPNVFSEVDWKPFSIPTLVDFFGDGSHDLIIQSSSKMSHYTRGTCISPSCNVCDMKQQKCICPEGMDGPQCTQCAKFYYRDSGGCKKCPGYGTETGTCWRRGVCQDDEMNEMSAISNFSHVEHLRSLGDSVALGLCRCLSPFAGIGCEEPWREAYFEKTFSWCEKRCVQKTLRVLWWFWLFCKTFEIQFLQSSKGRLWFPDLVLLVARRVNVLLANSYTQMQTFRYEVDGIPSGKLACPAHQAVSNHRCSCTRFRDSTQNFEW